MGKLQILMVVEVETELTDGSEDAEQVKALVRDYASDYPRGLAAYYGFGDYESLLQKMGYTKYR